MIIESDTKSVNRKPEMHDFYVMRHDVQWSYDHVFYFTLMGLYQHTVTKFDKADMSFAF